jgi:hypothetical protein
MEQERPFRGSPLFHRFGDRFGQERSGPIGRTSLGDAEDDPVGLALLMIELVVEARILGKDGDRVGEVLCQQREGVVPGPPLSLLMRMY